MSKPGDVEFEQPTGWAARSTRRDRSLPHQIIVWYDSIACNCGWWIRATPAMTDGDPYAFYLKHHPEGAPDR